MSAEPEQAVTNNMTLHLLVPAKLAAFAILALLSCTVAARTPAAAGNKTTDLPRADFFASCPFTVAAPSVVAVLDAVRWRNVLAASSVTPPPYEANATDFRREAIFIVALPYVSNSTTEAALATRHPERFDAKTGTLTIFYDVSTQPARETVGQPCLVTWTAARKDLQQVITRTSDGRFIAGARTAEKPKKKPSAPAPGA